MNREAESLPPDALKPGDTGNAVRDLQGDLDGLGFEVDITGVYDEATRAHVRQFQAAAGMAVTGIATPDVIARIANFRSCNVTDH